MSEPDDRYLWDQSGPEDREVARMEQLLARYRYDPRADAPPFALAPRRRSWKWLALAASVAVLAGAAWWLRPRTLEPGYEVRGIAALERAYAGDELRTGAQDYAVLEIGAIGDVRVQPDSHLRVEDTGSKNHKLFLERGSLQAEIFARPGVFQIGTPAGLSVDLGCKYDLSVDADGTARMKVLTGRVAFEVAGRRVVCPAGARCEASKRDGPSVPVVEDASADFVEAVRRLQFADEPDPADLAQVRDCDLRIHSVTLWHLYRLARSEKVVDVVLPRLEKAYPLPEGADRAGLVRRDADLLNRWQDEVEDDWR